MPKFAPIFLSGSSDDDFARVQKEVENAKRRLQFIGRPDLAETPESRSILNTVIDNLLRTGYGGTNVVRELLLPGEGATPDVFDPLQAYKRGFSLQEKATGKDVAKGLGISDEPLFKVRPFNKFTISPSPAGIAGLAADVFNPLDVLNWLSLGLGKLVTKGGKAGAELLPHAFGKESAKTIADLVGEETLKDISATTVSDLANKLIAKVPVENRSKLLQEIRKGMETAGTVTRTKIPGSTPSRSIVTRVNIPLLGTKVGEFEIPGSRTVTRVASNIGNKLAQSGIGDRLGRSFSNTFVPRTVPNSVVIRVITGDIQPGDPRWDEVASKVAGGFSIQSGPEAYRMFKQELHKVFEKSRKSEDDFRLQVEDTIFKGLSLQDRKDVMYHAATGTHPEDVPEKIRYALKEFIAWRESILKEYKNLGIPVRELENYVPFIVVGGRLSRSESELLKGMFKREDGRTATKSSENLVLYLAEKTDPHIKDRMLQATTPHEVNKLLGREWLTEDAALAMAMRGTKFIRAKNVVTFLQGMLDKYGLTIGDLAKWGEGVQLPKALKSKDLAKQLKDAGIDVESIAARGSLPEGYSLYQVRTLPSGGVYLEPLKDEAKKGFALPEEFVKAFNEYMDVYFNPQSQNEILRLWDRVTSSFRTVAYLWNPGHIARDFFSNIFNAWLGGVRSVIPYAEALRLYKPLIHDGDPYQTMMIPFLGENKSGEELFDIARKLGVVDTGQALGETAQSVKASIGKRPFYDPKKYTDTYTKLMINGTRMADNFTRFAMWIDGIMKGMNFEEAAYHTKKYLFDYFDLTPFERQWMRRIIPFYTWMRKNLPLQFEEVIKQPGKYAAIGKYQSAMSEETDKEKMPDYVEEGMGIKLPEGPYVMPNLPYADLQRIPHSIETFRELISNINPIIRYPVEVATNQEFFSGMPLEWYAGERTHLPVVEGAIERLLGVDIPDIIPKRTVGHLLNQVPMLRNLDTMADPENPRSFARLMSFLGFPPIYPEESVEKAATYEERDRLRAVIRMLLDQGIIVPSVRDIESMFK